MPWHASPGSGSIDPSSASTTLLWDLHTRDWATDLMAATGAPRRLSGTRCVRLAAVAGTLRPHVATEMGLGLRVRVVVGTGDEHSACLAAGALEPGLGV